MLEMVAAMEKSSGKKIPYKFGPRRSGDVASVWADTAKAKEALGWEAKFGLAEMCDDLWRWQVAAPLVQPSISPQFALSYRIPAPDQMMPGFLGLRHCLVPQIRLHTRGCSVQIPMDTDLRHHNPYENKRWASGCGRNKCKRQCVFLDDAEVSTVASSRQRVARRKILLCIITRPFVHTRTSCATACFS